MKNDKHINEDDNSVLSKIKKGGDFEIPANYFDEFKLNVQNQITQEKLPWFKLPQYEIVLGSIAVLLIGVFIMFNLEKPAELANVELSDEEIRSYLDEHIDDYHVADIIAEMSIPEITKLQNEVTKAVHAIPKNESELIDELTDDEIMEYLIEEGYDEGDWDEL